MKFVTFLNQGTELVGVLSENGERVYSTIELGLPYKDMVELISKITDEEKQRLQQETLHPTTEGYLMKDTELLAPIPRPRELLAVSQNYATHVRETCITNGVEVRLP